MPCQRKAIGSSFCLWSRRISSWMQQMFWRRCKIFWVSVRKCFRKYAVQQLLYEWCCDVVSCAEHVALWMQRFGIELLWTIFISEAFQIYLFAVIDDHCPGVAVWKLNHKHRDKWIILTNGWGLLERCQRKLRWFEQRLAHCTLKEYGNCYVAM